MDTVKKIWSLSFKVKKGDVSSLVVQLIILLVVCVIAGLVLGLLAKIPILGVIFSIVGSLVELYGLIGIVLCILVFLGTI